MDFINLPILAISLILVISILTSLVSKRANIPLILVFLCIGLAFDGEGALSIFPMIHQPNIAFFIGSVALALILFDSGYQTNLKNYHKTATPSIALASIGVFLTALFLAPAAYFFLGFTWLESFLLASIISSTDAAAVFFLLRIGGVSIRDKIKTTLEAESGSNDPMAIFLTLSFLMLMESSTTAPVGFILVQFFMQVGIGIFGGISFGFATKQLVNKLNFDVALYPILILGCAMSAFALVNLLGGSGYLCLYIMGILIGNARIKAHYQTLRFQSSLTWFCQIIMFLTLGFFANLQELYTLFIPSLILGVILLFVARPLSVFLCLFPFGYTTKEKLFISFVGLRGATSILLALMPLVKNLDNGSIIFNIIFLMVLMSLAVQGFFIIPFAKACQVTVPLLEKQASKTEIDLPDLTDSYLICYQLSEETPAVKGEHIPSWAHPVLIKRGGISYNPTNIRKLKAGDRIYVFALSEHRASLLDHLYGGGQYVNNISDMGDFVLSPDTSLAELSYLYGLQIPTALRQKSIRDVIEEYSSDLDIGDRFGLGNVDLIIRKKIDGVVSEIGLKLEASKIPPSFGRRFTLKKRT